MPTQAEQTDGVIVYKGVKYAVIRVFAGNGDAAEDLLNVAAISVDFEIPIGRFQCWQSEGWPHHGKRKLTPILRRVAGKRWASRKMQFFRRSEVEKMLRESRAFEDKIDELPCLRTTNETNTRKNVLRIRKLPFGEADELLNAAALTSEYGIPYGVFTRQQRTGWIVLDGEKLTAHERVVETLNGKRKQDFFSRGEFETTLLPKLNGVASRNGIYVGDDETSTEYNWTAAVRFLSISTVKMQKLETDGRIEFFNADSPWTGRPERRCTLANLKAVPTGALTRPSKRDVVRFDGVPHVPTRLALNELDVQRRTLERFSKRCEYREDDQPIRMRKWEGLCWWGQNDVQEAAAMLQKARRAASPDNWIDVRDIEHQIVPERLVDSIKISSILKVGRDSGQISFLQSTPPTRRDRWDRARAKYRYPPDVIDYVRMSLASSESAEARPEATTVDDKTDNEFNTDDLKSFYHDPENRDAYERDQLLLCWYEQMEGEAKIRLMLIDKWNSLKQTERAKIYPSLPNRIPENESGRNRIKTALRAARKDREKRQ